LYGATLFLITNYFVDKEILSKWYSFFILALLGGIFWVLQIRKQTLLRERNEIPIFVVLLFSYIFIQTCISLRVDVKQLLAFTCFLVLYFSFLYKYPLNTSFINWIIVILCLGQTAYGLGQYIEIFPQKSPFLVVGSFDNPAGFAVCVVAGLPFCLPLFLKRKFRILGLIIIFVELLMLILSQSRSGLIASVFMIALYSRNLNSNKALRRWMLILCVLICVGGMFFKQDSSIGRLVIWKASLSMLENNLFFGKGNDSFNAHYMQEQANFLEENNEQKYLQLADNVHHPFNEYLLFIIEYGVFGFLLFLLICIAILKNNKWDMNPCFLSFLGIAVFALFSYPLRYSFVWAILAYNLSQLSLRKNTICVNRWLLNNYIRCVIIVFMIGGIGVVLMNMRFEYEWKQLIDISMKTKKQIILKKYSTLYESIHKHPLFLYNYGCILNDSGYYKESLSVLFECEQKYNDYDVQLMIADNYFHLKQWRQSEYYYLNALNMCPNRFLPLYQLMQIYEVLGEKKNVVKLCKEIEKKEIKIPSLIIDKIKDEARQKILDYNSDELDYLK